MGDFRIGPLGTGTVTGTTGAAALVGTGTQFLTQLAIDDTLFISNVLGGYSEYTVLTISDDTNLVLSSNLAEDHTTDAFYITRDTYDLIIVELGGVEPRSSFDPGQFVTNGIGLVTLVGYARASWSFAAIERTEWTYLKTWLFGGSYSNHCAATTRDDEDAFVSYRGMVRLPNPSTLATWQEQYDNVAFDITLVEAL